MGQTCCFLALLAPVGRLQPESDHGQQQCGRVHQEAADGRHLVRRLLRGKYHRPPDLYLHRKAAVYISLHRVSSPEHAPFPV
jgi:hypothetical protein